MSGHSGSTTCPNCGNDAHLYSDYKPFDYSEIECLHCGLKVSPVLSYASLEELNERRIEFEMDELSELPEQDKDIF